MNLIIVESPTKARTLSRFLGEGYTVEATMGHIKDLPKSKLGVDIEKDFTPDYIEVVRKSDVIGGIIQKAKKADRIFLATDPDREGEAISAHVKEVLESGFFNKTGGKKAKKTDGVKISRIVFHEITKEAVEDAIKNPRGVDANLVSAQIARRVLDRLVGYKLSPLLWKKVRRGLSAGRVQTVAVRLIIEKEREIEAFKPEEYWDIACLLATQSKKPEHLNVKLTAINGKKARISGKNQADGARTDLEKSQYQVADISRKEVHKSPSPPFTTSTLTQAASRMYFWSSKKTMNVAQRLYEEGLITYHRTDSTQVATSAIEKAREYIVKNLGKEYLPPSARFYTKKAKTAQEAHEAIRPTNVFAEFKVSDQKYLSEAKTLYTLIWKRFLASQINASIYDETKITVSANPKGENRNEYLLSAYGLVMKFDGWKKLFTKKEGDDLILPEVKQGEELDLIKVDSEQKFTLPPARYTEATLIKTLEKLGIGRPSTYAPIISTIQIRNYVEKKEGKFYPTKVGIAVNDFLLPNFPETFDYAFTADMEDKLDKVADGSVSRVTLLEKFWKPLSKIVIRVEKKAKRVKIEVEKLGRKCPECKKQNLPADKQGELVVRIGRFGKFISCSRFPDCRYTEKFIEKINMKCPDCKKGEVIIKKSSKGRRFFGCSRYPECKWASWRKPQIDESKSQ